MPLLKAYLGVLIAFLVIDAIWINMVVLDYYERTIGHLLVENPNVAAAGLFYLIYPAGIVLLAVRPALHDGGLKAATLNGAVLGGIAYGTYTLTNYAVLTGWTVGLVISDIAWGVFITALSAVCGYWLERR